MSSSNPHRAPWSVQTWGTDEDHEHLIELAKQLAHQMNHKYLSAQEEINCLKQRLLNSEGAEVLEVGRRGGRQSEFMPFLKDLQKHTVGKWSLREGFAMTKESNNQLLLNVTQPIFPGP